ncbi:MAG TPA: thioesterase domain-containing protein [Stellaceae bacterium]|nr:thioesterase domain-containing protein [Stellaceae bacterium]
MSAADNIALWERVLDVSPIGLDDDFFDLGGDSLVALQLFHEIERATGRSLPITAIYEAATPRRLMELLDGAAHASFSPLVTIRPGMSEPLFVFHGVGGNVVELQRFGRSIDTDHPVIAVQAKGVDGLAEPLDRMEQMVDFYLPALRARQPHGPYYFAGYSFGGLLAMEIARRLRAKGETIALLLFIDTFAHQVTFPKSARQIIRLRTVLNAFRTMPPREALRFTVARLTGQPTNRAKQVFAAEPLAASATALRKVYDAANEALLHYRPLPYAGKIVFLRARTSIFPIAPARIWGKLVDGIELHSVDADHDSVVRGDSAALAAMITNVLRRVNGAA